MALFSMSHFPQISCFRIVLIHLVYQIVKYHVEREKIVEDGQSACNRNHPPMGKSWNHNHNHPPMSKYRNTDSQHTTVPLLIE